MITVTKIEAGVRMSVNIRNRMALLSVLSVVVVVIIVVVVVLATYMLFRVKTLILQDPNNNFTCDGDSFSGSRS